MAGGNADASKARAEDAWKRPPAGGVLHQRRRLPFSPATMAVGGFLIVATIGYFVLYSKSKPGTSASEVVKATTGTDDRSRPNK